jgi:hypothetical protein
MQTKACITTHVVLLILTLPPFLSRGLQTALKEGAQHMDFMGKAVEVNLNAGLFVTLNPAGKGYGGRSKLPDNLQQMFRYVGNGEGCLHSTEVYRNRVAWWWWW